MNKKVLITGATSGLGLMLTKFFDENNFDLVVTGRNKKKLSEIKKKISISNKKNCYAFDLNNKKNLTKFCNIIKKQKNNFDVVVHCLGGGFGKHNPLIDQQDLNFLFNVNVSVGAEINNILVSTKKYNKGLKLIHIASVAAIEATASVGYSMVKASLIAYTKSLAKALINKNIFVHCLLPGAFEYENNAFERLKMRNKKVYNNFIKKKLPRKKITRGDEFKGLFDFLISNDSNLLTGSSILADYAETNSYRI